MPEKIRVAVVFGGRSSEHAISCVTAGGVLAAIDRDRYEVLPVGITRDGRWVRVPGERSLAIADGTLPEVPGDAEELDLQRTLDGVDVVLPLLHGPYGEDGTIQGLLELAGVRYVGAGVLASAAGMDKAFMKLIWQAQGLPVGPYVIVTDREWRLERERKLDEIKQLGWPVFVKPARAGSSMGISRVTREQDLVPAIEAAREHDPKLIVEAGIEGLEVECGVLEGVADGPNEASLPAEIVMLGRHDFYDFETKYLDGTSRLEIPAGLPPEVVERLRETAVRAFDALGCEGLARVDFFVTPGHELVLNEINTMPGFTPTSAFPQMWAATGVDYPSLVDRLIQTALRRPVGLR
ncbi:D-alanine--D-alanine ligase family protein [Actinocorallia populi]|uniref:D-alanine--D-alanine ligase family protein n=1 Tax=Actinocorallia populi TaxID=2079200 RepID=UPI000D091707|nr:D-alanine--D-alanine ligase family protein [Actinocorallia populi]